MLAMILNALDRDAADGKQARAEMAAELRALLSAPSPANHVEDVRAMVAAPSPAGVDGCKGKNCGATDSASHSAECIAEHEQACGRADSNGLPVVACLIGGEPSLTPCPVRGVVNEPLCRLSDAQATIDGLRGDLAVALKVPSVAAMRAYLDTEFAKDNMRLGTERDQQAQRIGELERLLRDCYPGCGLTARQTQSIRERIDAALSAGKEGE